jgi:type VI secretion system secreted protein Hcp
MFRILGKVFGSPSSCQAIRRTYRPAIDVLESRAVPAVDAFIWFETPGALQGHYGSAGEHPDDKAFEIKRAFEIKDFSFGVENPTSIGSATGGAGAGKIKFNEFTIKKTTDSASPAFFKNCCAGAHYSEVVIEMRKAGGDPVNNGKPFLEFKFDTVFTTKIDWSGPSDEGPEESITFVYGKLGVKYWTQEATGAGESPTGPVTTGEVVIHACI